MPIEKATNTITISNTTFSITLIPNTGRLVNSKGSNAQWMAHASEVAIPKASQLIFEFILRTAKVKVCNKVAK